MISTSYHLAAPSKTPLPQKMKDIRKQNNFMSIIETTSKEEGKPNPKSQSVLQDYNIKYEKKPADTTNTSNHTKKKSNIENSKTTALSKLIKGNHNNYKTEQNYNKNYENIIRFSFF